MAITTTTRFGIYRWSSDADAFTRTQMDTSHEYIEEYAGKMIRGAGAPSAVGAEYKNTIYLNTTNNKLYYYSATDGSGSWQILETAVVQNSLADAKGDMIVASANDTWAKLSVGTQGTILTVGASATVGWATPAIQTPAGTISATIAASAPSGWLFLEGQAIANAEASYPGLWAVAPSAWKVSTTLNLPDWRGYYMASYKAASPLFGTLGGTVAGGTTIGSANLPTHTHAIDHSHSAGTTVAGDVSHTHTINHGHSQGTTSNNSVSHTHTINHGHTVNSNSGLSVSAGFHAHKIFQGDAIDGLGFVRRLTNYSSQYVVPFDNDNNGIGDGIFTNHTGMAVDFVTDTSLHHGHQHSVTIDSHSGSSGNNSAAHTHTIDVPAGGGNSGAMSANSNTHTHSFTTPAFTGTSGNGGFANNPYVMPAGVINWIIKAH